MYKEYDEGVNGIPFDAIDDYHELLHNKNNKNMCGLVGFSGKAETKIFKALHLLADNDSRGGHSTGLFANNKIYKGLEESLNILPILDTVTTGSVLIGHTRYATHGGHTIENAHPFQHKGIIGAHNGVLNNYEEVGEKFGIPKTTVDSEMIIKVLGETKDHKNLGLFGGAKNVIYTAGDNKLYVYRKDNPLYFLKTEDGIYYSSLKDGLNAIKNKGEKVKEVKENKLYIIENGDIKQVINIKHKPIASTKLVNTNWRSYGGYGGQSFLGIGGGNDDDFDFNDYEDDILDEAIQADDMCNFFHELESEIDGRFSQNEKEMFRKASEHFQELAEQEFYNSGYNTYGYGGTRY